MYLSFSGFRQMAGIGGAFNRQAQHIIFSQNNGVYAIAYRARIYYTDTLKAEIRDRWQRGETLHSIARLIA
jgi:hypothetical protein